MHELSDAGVAELRRMVAGEGLQVVAVDPPSFKAIELDEVPVAEVTRNPAVVEHLEQIRRSCQVACELGAGIVRLFSFRRGYMASAGNPSPREPRGGAIPDDLLPKIVAGLRAAAAIADEHQVTLGLENVRSCWGNSGHNAARILAAVDHPRLRAIWDPGNDFVSGGVPYPDGYRAVLPVPPPRARQGRRGGGRRHRPDALGAIGSGAVDYAGQIDALRGDGYAGVVSVETHWRKEGASRLESTRETLAAFERFCSRSRLMHPGKSLTETQAGMRPALAASLYRGGSVSLGKAAKISGSPKATLSSIWAAWALRSSSRTKLRTANRRCLRVAEVEIAHRQRRGRSPTNGNSARSRRTLPHGAGHAGFVRSAGRTGTGLFLVRQPRHRLGENLDRKR